MLDSHGYNNYAYLHPEFLLCNLFLYSVRYISCYYIGSFPSKHLYVIFLIGYFRGLKSTAWQKVHKISCVFFIKVHASTKLSVCREDKKKLLKFRDIFLSILQRQSEECYHRKWADNIFVLLFIFSIKKSNL